MARKMTLCYLQHDLRAPNPAVRDERLQDHLLAECELFSGVKLPL
ncbi:hypothetical protein B0G77_3300 [Paraburkholderia sp. BL10I2N1]|nr:hypothetical protein B0G77_3300 [Paraburkholderia sp. BL10I2N1]